VEFIKAFIKRLPQNIKVKNNLLVQLSSSKITKSLPSAGKKK